MNLGKVICRLCNSEYGAKFGASEGGTRCKGQLPQGDATVPCTYIFKSAHEKTMEGKRKKVKEAKAKSTRSDAFCILSFFIPSAFPDLILHII